MVTVPVLIELAGFFILNDKVAFGMSYINDALHNDKSPQFICAIAALSCSSAYFLVFLFAIVLIFLY